MKKLFTLLTLLCAFFMVNAQIAGWQFGVPASLGSEATYNATTTAANTAVSVLSRGAGISSTGLARAFSATAFTVAGSKANAIATNQYFAFSLSANPGYQLSLSTLDAKIRRSGTGPNMYIWQYSLNNVNFFDIGADVSYNLATADGDVQPQLNLSVIPALQNVAAGTVIYFRLYAWGASGAGGTFAIGRYGAGISTNSLEIGGAVTVPCVPFAVGITSTPPSNSLCQGQQTILQASGGVSYTWNPGNVVNNPVIFTPMATTTYTVVATDANNCTSSSTVTISVTTVAAPTPVTATPNVLCGPGAGVNLNAVSAGNSINWYTVPSGGVSIGNSASGANFAVTPGATTTYYAESQAPAGGSQTFAFTGAMQTFTVPAGITSLNVETWGAQGANAAVGGTGGLGGYASGNLAVTPGQVINIFVGGQNGYNGGGVGGLNGNSVGGGPSLGNAPNGGGASDIRVGGAALLNRVIVAGGGGGAGYNGVWPACQVAGPAGNGGAGGNAVGATGTFGVGAPCNCLGGGGAGGTGGTQLAGGIAGGYNGNNACLRPNYTLGSNGTLGIGGNGALTYYNGTGGGGGGGGGHYGGGSGGSGSDTTPGGGGGGGSSNTDGVTSPILTPGIRAGNGQVIISWIGAGCGSFVRTPVTVTVNPVPAVTATASPATICAGSSSTLSGGGAATYSWDPGALVGSPVVTPAATTTYTVTGTNGAGCTATSTVTVTVNSNPTVTASASPAIICAGSSSALTGGGAVTYTWDPGALVGNPSVSPVATTTYTVTGTNAAGCTGTSIATVTVSPTPTVSASASPVAICAGGSSTLSASGSGGTGPYTYQWIDGIVSNTITINPMKDNTIFEENPSNSNATGPNMVAGNNGVGFKGRALMAFDIAGNIPAGATVNTASLQLNCSLTNGGAGAQTHFLHKLNADWGEGTSFSAQAGAGTAATTNDATWNTRFFPGTNWITAGGDFNAIATASTVVDATGLYTWTSAQMAADIQNWVNTPATNFGWLLKGIESAPTQAKRYDTRENGNAGNRPQLTINYSTPNVVGNTATLNNMPAGTYTVIVTDANGCTSSSVVTVTVNTLPTVTASPVTQTVCENGMATISGGGAATYTWTGGITDATPFMVVAAGNYTVTGTDANGCSNTATAEVLMNAAPVITAGATPNTTCDQTTVTPSASGAGTIVWSGGLTNNVPFVAVATTTYTVTGTDGLGCSASTTVLVTVNPMSGILAPATSNQAQDHGDDFDINYYAANCDLIATVDDGAGGNVLGLTTSTVNVDATAGFHNGQPFVRRWYQITPTNNGSADVVLYINQSDFDDYNAAVALPYLPLPTSGNNADPNIGNIRITKNADAGLGNSPVVITPTANWNGTYWELSFNTPSFSQFRVHSVNPGNVPLPATVTSFSGLKLESSDKLSWTTSSEQSNAYFTLQHSTDGTNFTTIAKVNSKAQNGNSATELNYSSIHATPSLGHNYYRLQQTDLDNKLSVHAQIVDLIWGTNGSTVSIYPNPTRDILNIDLYAATAQNTTVKLLDMSGRVIKQIQAKSAVGMNNIKLSMGEIASGVYTVQVYENNQLSHTSKVKKND